MKLTLRCIYVQYGIEESFVVFEHGNSALRLAVESPGDYIPGYFYEMTLDVGTEQVAS